MKVLIISRIPARQGFVGPIKERITVEEAECDSVDEIVPQLHVPQGGECRVVPVEHVTTVKSRCINEVID